MFPGFTLSQLKNQSERMRKRAEREDEKPGDLMERLSKLI